MFNISDIVDYWNKEALDFTRKDELEDGLLLNLRNKIVLKVDGWNEGIRKGVFNLESYDYEEFIIMDILDVILSRARNNYKDVSFIISDIRKLPIRTDTLEFVLDISTSDHLDFKYFNDIIEEYNRVLKIKGEIFIIFNKYNILGKIIVRLRRFIKYKEVSSQFKKSYWFKVNKVISALTEYFVILIERDCGSELMSTYRKPFFLPPRYFYMSYMIWCVKYDA